MEVHQESYRVWIQSMVDHLWKSASDGCNLSFVAALAMAQCIVCEVLITRTYISWCMIKAVMVITCHFQGITRVQ